MVFLQIYILRRQIGIRPQNIPRSHQRNARDQTRRNRARRLDRQELFLPECRDERRLPGQICVVIDIVEALVEENVIADGVGDRGFGFLGAGADNVERDVVLHVRCGVGVDKVVEIAYDACVVARSVDPSLDREGDLLFLRLLTLF